MIHPAGSTAASLSHGFPSRSAAATHGDLHEFQIDVLDSQTQAFHESQSRAVEQAHGQAAGLGQHLEETGQLGSRKHDRHTATLHAFEAPEIHLQHGAEKEEQRVEGLVLMPPSGGTLRAGAAPPVYLAPLGCVAEETRRTTER